MKLAAALLVSMTPTVATACPLSDATYSQVETGYGLQFRPTTPEDGLTVTNAFDMTLPGSDQRVAGEVIWGNGFSRPIGALRYQCPVDPSEEDEDLCVRWRGIVYAVNGSTISLLPDQTDPAPEQVILANLGQTIRYSALIEALEVEISDLPWDVFQLQGCR